MSDSYLRVNDEVLILNISDLRLITKVDLLVCGPGRITIRRRLHLNCRADLSKQKHPEIIFGWIVN